MDVLTPQMETATKLLSGQQPKSDNRKKPVGQLKLADWLVPSAQSGNSRCPMNALLIFALSSL